MRDVLAAWEAMTPLEQAACSAAVVAAATAALAARTQALFQQHLGATGRGWVQCFSRRVQESILVVRDLAVVVPEASRGVPCFYLDELPWAPALLASGDWARIRAVKILWGGCVQSVDVVASAVGTG